MANSRGQSVRAERRERELSLRRADVVRAATAVFAEKGFYGAQVSEIAAAAEVSLASVYAMFKGKEELYEEVTASAAAAVRDKVRGRVEAVGDPRERLLCMVDSLFSCFEENQDLLLLYVRATQGLPWKVRQEMGETSLVIFREFTAWAVGVAQQAERAGHLRGFDPEAVALSVIGAVTTTAARWIENTPDRPLSKAAPPLRAIFERVLEGALR